MASSLFGQTLFAQGSITTPTYQVNLTLHLSNAHSSPYVLNILPIELVDVVGCLCGIGDLESVGSKWKKRDLHILTDP